MAAKVVQTTGVTYAVMTPEALVKFPKALAVVSPRYKVALPSLHITPKAVENLTLFTKPDTIIELLLKAEKANIVEVRDVGIEYRWWTYVIEDLARNLIADGEKVIIVATEREKPDLIRNLDPLSIINSLEVITVSQYREFLNRSDSIINTELLELANKFKRERGYSYLRFNWMFIPLLILELILSFKLPELLGTMGGVSVWLAVVLVLSFSVFLYWYRAKHRLAYGILESTFGVIVASKVIYSNLDYTKLAAIDYIQLATGIYVIVRGLDNVEKGLVYIDSETFKDLWNRIFGSPQPRI